LPSLHAVLLSDEGYAPATFYLFCLEKDVVFTVERLFCNVSLQLGES
jgi:hypothetical protein